MVDVLKEVLAASDTARVNVRLALHQKLEARKDEVLAVVRGDDGTSARAVTIAQLAECLCQLHKTLGEIRESKQWELLAERWRETANLRMEVLSEAWGRD